MEIKRVAPSARHRIQQVLDSNVFNVALSTVIIIVLLPILLGSADFVRAHYGTIRIVNTLSTLFFIAEYTARLMTATIAGSHRVAHQSAKGYAFSFFGIIDFLIIPLFIVPLIATFRSNDARAIVEIAKVLLLFKLIRYSFSFRLLVQAVSEVWVELMTVMSASWTLVLISAIAMYFIEHEAQPEKFATVWDGIWWAVITFATVGYGDIYPITPFGKLIAMIISMLGIAMIALPSGLIGSSVRNVLNEKRKNEPPSGSERASTDMDERLRKMEESLKRIEEACFANKEKENR